MPQQTLDYQSPPRKRRWPNWRRVTQSALAAAGIIVVVNLGMIGLAARDRSWGAMGIMLIYGPIVNGVMILASLGGIPIVRHLAGGAPIKPYVLTGVLVPLGGIIVDFVCIASMDLHGC